MKDIKRPEILVIGSFMMDLVVRTPRVPENGETVIGLDFRRFPGGKGANQAVAAARLGGKVTMAGKLGQDTFGGIFLDVLQGETINVEHILQDVDAPTGVGSITLEESGSNRIVVVPGANMHYSLEDLGKIELIIAQSDIMMLQLEMDLEVMKRAVVLASKYKVPVLLNPAPAQELSDGMLSKVSYLTPNETEAEILTGVAVVDVETATEAANILRDKGVHNVVVTLAEKGALVASESGIEYVPGFSVHAIDTVAAGDAFNGALAVAIAQGQSLPKAVRYANAVGALTVTRQGAIPSLPSSDEVEKFLLRERV